MEDIKIVVDAGHGGEDPGAVKNDLNEKDLTLMISKYMEDELKKAGIPVTMTRIDDETLSKDERVKRILEAYGNKQNVIVISNHINSTNDEQGPEGAEVIYALRNNSEFAQNILDELEKEGQKVRKVYQRTLPDDETKDYYFIHRETGNTTPVIIEYGYINNPNDLKRIQENYKDYVNAVIKAIKKTFNNKTNIVTYVVQPGDTLWSIAQKYGVSLETLRRVNNIYSNMLTIGQTIKIPTENITSNNEYLTHVVQPGDTLWSIAQKYDVSLETLRRANSIYSDMLSVGQIIKIPIKNITFNDEYLTYSVQPGDTLWSIAKRFNTTVDSIVIANKLLNSMLMIGQQLKIPIKNHIYIVRYGDSLWEIARRFQTTVENLKAMNNLTTNTIYIGQTLKVM